MAEVHLLADTRCTLGEGALWHPERGELFFFDILERRLHACDADGGRMREWTFERFASAAGWIDRNHLMISDSDGLLRFSIEDGVRERVCEVEAGDDRTRSNDGRVDRSGAFWISTMDVENKRPLGALYRYRKGEIETIRADQQTPNALAFSPDGTRGYYTDTAAQRILTFPIEPATGEVTGEFETFVDLSASSHRPDGAICDSEGYLWNCQYGSWRVVRYAPDGREDTVVEVPVGQPTCPAIGGPGMRRLYLTSARQGLAEADFLEQPEAGSVFWFDLDVPGVPEARVSGD